MCSTFTPAFTGLDVSERMNKVRVVQVTFPILSTKCRVLKEFSWSPVNRWATLISNFNTDVYIRLADGNPVDTLSPRAIH